MSQKLIGKTRLQQETAGSIINADFTELYGDVTALENDLVLITLDNETAAGSFVVPKGYRIQCIAIQNTTANAVTGGLKFGTTAGATDVVAAQAVGANALVLVPAASLLASIFSTTANQTVYYDAVTAWNGASVKIRVALQQLFA